MSHVQHQAMCITSWDKDKLIDCRERINSIGMKVSEVMGSDVNSYYTFFIPPCGSKAGWKEETVHLLSLQNAEEIIQKFNYEDGSSSFDYTTAVYGECEG